MSKFKSPARLLLAAGAAFMLLAAGCTKPLPDQSDAKLTVTATQPSGTYAPGDDVAFRVTVTNAGTRDVGLLSISSTLATGLDQRSLVCSPLGLEADTTGTTAPCDGFIYLRSLAAGASVTLDFVATVAANATGTLSSNFTAAVNSGPAAVTATNQATVVDMRGGSYTAFTSDGRRVALAADFAGKTLTFDTGASAVAVPFTPQSLDASNLFDAETGFMTHLDLLAGNAPLNGATPVFLAARNFVTSAAALEGHTFIVFGIDTPTSGAATSSIEGVAFSGGTMQVCVGPQAIASCPAGSLRSYALSVSGGVFTGVDATDNDTRTFQVAQSGSSLVFLRGEPVADGRAFQVGLSTNSGLVDDVLLGGDNTGRFGKLAIESGGLEESFGAITAPLSVFAYTIAGQPSGLGNASLASGTAVYVVEDGGLAVVAGASSNQPGADGSGLIQVFAH